MLHIVVSNAQQKTLSWVITAPPEVVVKVMFLLVSVILSTAGEGGCLPLCSTGIPPLGADTPPGADPQSRPPWDQTPPGADTPREDTPPSCRRPRADDPLRADTPWSRHPPSWELTPPPLSRHQPEQTPPWEQTPPHKKADSSIRSMSGRYASYWNAFLFLIFD